MGTIESMYKMAEQLERQGLKSEARAIRTRVEKLIENQKQNTINQKYQ